MAGAEVGDAVELHAQDPLHCGGHGPSLSVPLNCTHEVSQICAQSSAGAETAWKVCNTLHGGSDGLWHILVEMVAVVGGADPAQVANDGGTTWSC